MVQRRASRVRRRSLTWLSALLLAGLLAALPQLVVAPGTARAALMSCSSYPAPGQIAPVGAAIPHSIADQYAIFRHKSTPADRISLGELQSPLQASGIVTAGVRYLGRAAGGIRFYAVPARHYTRYEIAPLRCFAAGEKAVEKSLLPSLRKDYRQAAICIVELGLNPRDGAGLENCGPAQGIATAMLATDGVPLLGMAPDSVRSVQATYIADPARIIRVHDNFYAISGGVSAPAPCAVSWLDPSGNVKSLFEGCDYETAELPEYQQYQSFVTSQFVVVQQDVSALSSAITSGNIAAAESAWLTAHLAWLQIGQDDKQYGAFGNLGNSIDGTSSGLVGGAASTQFTGFHKIEMDLWAGDGLAAAAADTAALQQLLAQLAAVPLGSELPDTTQGVANWLLRPHEILEDAIRDTLTGDDDYGSGSGVASITADVSAVEEDLALMAPTLDPLAPRLIPTADRQLNTVVSAADATQVNASWVAIAALPNLQRGRLDAAVGAAVEMLSRIPDLLTSTGPAAPPT